jgi:hypothetical protein
MSEWFKRFREGCEELEDDPSSVWASTALNLETVAKGHKPVSTDHQTTLTLMHISDD